MRKGRREKKNLEFLLDKFMSETRQLKPPKKEGLRNAPLTYINSISYKKWKQEYSVNINCFFFSCHIDIIISYRSSWFWNCSIRKWTDMRLKEKYFLCWKCSWLVKILGNTQNRGGLINATRLQRSNMETRMKHGNQRKTRGESITFYSLGTLSTWLVPYSTFLYQDSLLSS